MDTFHCNFFLASSERFAAVVYIFHSIQGDTSKGLIELEVGAEALARGVTKKRWIKLKASLTTSHLSLCPS